MPENHKNNGTRDYRLIQYLEGELPEKEIKHLEQEIEKSSAMQQELQELTLILEKSEYQQELRLPDEQVEKITQSITIQTTIHPSRKPWPVKPLGIGLLAAATLLIFFFQLYQPQTPANLDWEATEFQTLSQEIELASVLLAEGAWLEESQNNVLIYPKTANALLDAQLQLLKLESSLFDSLFILNQ